METSDFLTAEWKNLVMANYEIDSNILKKYLPAGTELDDFNGKTYVSLVGFLFQNTKVKSIPIPFHGNFEEINLRFYVKYKKDNEWKRGVVFIKEIVSKPLVSLVANTVYNEHYMVLKTKYDQQYSASDFTVAYHWEHNDSWNWLKATGELCKSFAPPGSLEEFITEHYWGYTKVDRTLTSEYEVSHKKWNIHPVNNYSVNCDFGKLYGEDFNMLNSLKPSSVFIVDGSEISVKDGTDYEFKN
jgi:uncharacterized protein